MTEPIRILIVEDLSTDAELAKREINKTLKSCLFQRVQTRQEFLAAMETFQPDLIVSDYKMPHFDGLTALKLALEYMPLTPVIILTGAINEDTAVECMKAGAADYVIKEHIKRLGQAVIHALENKQLRREHLQAEEALRESEKRFRGLYENATIGIIRTTPEGRILMANPAAIYMLGYASLAEAQDHLGKKEFMPASSYSEFRRRMESDGSITGFESAWIRKDGSTIFVRESALVIYDENRKVLYYDGTFEDITERKQAEEAQVKLEEQLRQTQKMESIGQLAGGVAHDFNNLLTVIRGYCDLMQTQMSGGDPRLEELEQIRRASERAATLTRQLLAFSRKQMLAPTILDLNDLVANLRKMLERLIGEDITLSTVLQPGLWPVIADSGQIEQVIMNLAVNARDAMPTGGRLTIETGNISLDDDYITFESPTKDYVMLVVTDTGCGMDKQTQARVFEPFFTTKELGKGTGLGLATAYGIIKQSGGNITFYSELDRGTTFKIYLPVDKSATYNLAVPQTHSAIPGGNETILLVEDEEIVRSLVRTVLQANGYTILEAQRGDEALALAQQYDGSIDLLLTDVVMPLMSGRKLAEQLKVFRPLTKVLFMSGYTDDRVVRPGVLAAEVEFLSKPFSPSLLASKVREVLDK